MGFLDIHCDPYFLVFIKLIKNNIVRGDMPAFRKLISLVEFKVLFYDENYKLTVTETICMRHTI